MDIDVLTLFPGIARGPLKESILARAQKKGLVRIRVRNLRDYARGRHRVTDDRPYGGGPGMVMKPEPLFEAVEKLQRQGDRKGSSKTHEKSWVILMSPTGRRFEQEDALRLSQKRRLIFLCGHYEGFDQRVHDALADEEISIGDYVLTNGALAAMVVVDALVRLIPGVVGDAESVRCESFSTGILDHPHYTRPADFRGQKVPPVLLSGDHAMIDKWRGSQAMQRTKKMRRDLAFPLLCKEGKGR